MPKLLINTKTPILELDGSDAGFTMGDAIGTILSSMNTGGKMRMFKLARDFKQKDMLELDSADYSVVYQAVESTQAYTGNLVPGQVLEFLDGIKHAPKKSESPYVDTDEEILPPAVKKRKH